MKQLKRKYRVWYKAGFSKNQIEVEAITAAEAKTTAESFGLTVTKVWLKSK